MLTYLIINILTILVPFLFSFERKISFLKKWKYLFPAILISGIIFIAWDSFFTQNHIWGFNPEYLTGKYYFSLPIEEILFFVCVPYACIFIYEIISKYSKDNASAKSLNAILIFTAVLFLITGSVNLDKTYTSVVFIMAGGLIFAQIFLLRAFYLERFMKMFLISLLPMLVVNGILTNGIKAIDSGPIVWYNNAENIGVRIVGIPVEDFIYNFILLLTNVTFYEFFRKKEN